MRRDLKNYRWEFSNKKITITDKRREWKDGSDVNLVLDKIGFMSLARFILSAQDRLRLDDLRVIKNKLNSLKEKYRKKHANHPTASSKRQIKGTSTTKTSSTTKKDTDTSLVV